MDSAAQLYHSHSLPPLPSVSPKHNSRWQRAEKQMPFFNGGASAQPHSEVLNSRPINDYESDAGSEVPGSPNGSVNLSHAATFTMGQHIPSSMPSTTSNHSHSQLPHSSSSGTLYPNGINSRSQPANMALVPRDTSHTTQVVVPYGRPSSVDQAANSQRFRQDAVIARTGGTLLERYKAFVRLFNGLKRDMQQMAIEQPYKPGAWNSPEHQAQRMDLLCRIVEVGESLAIFGTAEFGERSNSSRAINIKDYAYLLKAYGEAFWPLYKQEFVEAIPQALQDDMLSVRGLLATRFEANAIIQEQLLKHVGLEGQGQGAVVYNTSMVNANPVNRLYHKPLNTVQTYASSVSKALQKSQNKYGAIAVGAVAGLLLLKRTGILGFIPGMARPRRRPAAYDDTDGDVVPSSSRRRRHSIGGDRLTADERLLLAFDHVDRSYKELQKAQRDIELLSNDWRLGPVRLSSPFGGPHPPGYQPVDVSACEPRVFMHSQLGPSF